jgi:hypothetical protein
MSFCPTPSPPITKTTYVAAYIPPEGISSCLPPLPILNADKTFSYSNSVITSTGTVDSTKLNAFVNTLLTRPPNTLSQLQQGNPAQDFSAKTKALRDSMQNEYCHYYSRYIWGLTYVLTNASQQGGVVDPEVKAKTAELNNKLNGILLVMKAAVNNRSSTLTNYYERDVNSLNDNLETARTNLARHSEILKNNNLKSDAQAAMIDYSIEKNSSSRNLLAVYGFMNIVAAGLLFYLYTNMKQ